MKKDITALKTNAEKDLDKLKEKIRLSDGSIREHIANILKYLSEIKKRKLFYLDGSRNFRAFIVNNEFDKLLSITMMTIAKLTLHYDYLTSRGVSHDECVKLGFPIQKMEIIRKQQITDPKKLKECLAMSYGDLQAKYGLKTQQGASGLFLKKFEPRKNCILKSFDLEIPKKNTTKFEAGFVQLCAKCDVKIL